MKICSECNAKMNEMTGTTPEGINYKYYKCGKCNEEIVDMKQLHNVAEKYRTMKRYRVKLSKWGLSLGIRIPKELVNKYKLSDDEEVSIIPEKDGILIIPS
ncbi:MAG: AbrB/MazE/SpoVT family DNA-binding domain-containing protein [Candidatus Woesearchaeota archaeon]